MAPLYTKKGEYEKAAQCLIKVVEEEDQQILKVGLHTKIAGNYKKANSADKCI